jgi:hypothetical protein
VSLISTLQIGTPLFWDMYKELGGFHEEQAVQFLDWIDRDAPYRDIFLRLNGRKPGGISVSECRAYLERQTWDIFQSPKNIVEEIEKYIDSFHFSL